MKQYKFEAFCAGIDVEMNSDDYQELKSLYNDYKKRGDCFKGHIVSNVTGEVFRSFHKEFAFGGVEVTEWVSLY